MKLGIAMTLPHISPEQWAEKHKNAGLSAVVFPCNHKAETAEIDAYVKASKDYDLTIAEVGAWSNPMDLDPEARSRNFDYCRHQLELAEYVGACCCVNIAGAKGPVWDGGYPDNYTEETYWEIVDCVQRLIDSVKPQKTCYTLEPMPWMHPDSPEDYLQMVRDIQRDAFGVHLDMVNMISSPQKYLFNQKFTNDAIAMLGPDIKSCHIKDMVLESSLTVSLKEVPCGEGGFDLKNYMDQLDKLDSDLPVIIEHLNQEEAYYQAIRYLQGLREDKKNG